MNANSDSAFIVHHSSFAWLLRRLRLINTRNRLTHLILLSVVEAQTTFLHSGAWTDLDPLTLTALSRRLACAGGHTRSDPPLLPPGMKTLDLSIVSRAVQGFAVQTPSGDDVSLRCLLPNAQAVLRYRLRALLDDETHELKRGVLERPGCDDELRRQVQARWGQNVSRRTVAAARQALGVAAWYRRAGRPVYPPPGLDFSPPRPMTPDEVLAHTPDGPGVYEIALSKGEFTYPTRASPVIYLGRSRNLRDRLRAHLSNVGKFGSEPGDGRLVFRFAAVRTTRLREAEADLIQAFCEAYGALPCHNSCHPIRRAASAFGRTAFAQDTSYSPS